MVEYVESKLDGKNYCVTNGHFMRHLRDNGLTRQEYHEKYVTGIVELCPHCSEPRIFVQSTLSYITTCGSRKCQAEELKVIRSKFTPEKNADINKKRLQTVRIKYGVDFVNQTPEHIALRSQKRNQIMPDGRTNDSHRQDKVRATKLEKYGDQYYNNSTKIKQSKSEHTLDQKIIINDKRAATNLEKYGVEFVLLLPNTSKNVGKANNRIKDFQLPSGKIIGIRGAEDKAIQTLLLSYDESDLRICDHYNFKECGVPIIPYLDSQNKRHKYYPDIYIPVENKIIEIKSRWWYDGHGKIKYQGRLEMNGHKRQACLDSGRLFNFWIYETNGSMVMI